MKKFNIPPKNKYRAIKAEADGIVFHSKGERFFYLHLKMLQVKDKFHLHRQIPLRYRLGDGPWHSLVIDFMLIYPDGKIEYIDFKGKILNEFKHKREAVEAFYPGLKIKVIRLSGGRFVECI